MRNSQVPCNLPTFRIGFLPNNSFSFSDATR
jgi:hypothetical protein